jgi:hypothetical protein
MKAPVAWGPANLAKNLPQIRAAHTVSGAFPSDVG